MTSYSIARHSITNDTERKTYLSESGSLTGLSSLDGLVLVIATARCVSHVWLVGGRICIAAHCVSIWFDPIGEDSLFWQPLDLLQVWRRSIEARITAVHPERAMVCYGID